MASGRWRLAATPDQAERLARNILADLDGFAERCAKVSAAMGLDMRRPKPLAVVPKTGCPTVDDTLVLGLAAACMRARAEAALVWARGDEADMHGARDMPSQSAGDQVTEFLRDMDSLAVHEPRTIRSAVAALNVALDVLMHRLLEPDVALAEGPVIEIVSNVWSALERVDPDTPLVTETGAHEGGNPPILLSHDLPPSPPHELFVGAGGCGAPMRSRATCRLAFARRRLQYRRTLFRSN